ncbi:3 exoribonuclease family protein [Niveomyces insectorum RCEF 264]|uniref:3 exoribonuclease family protein n=1 Tax=Niveomyces insectorum RCEF 264 TaxID=1081102 RepID=A0A168AII4_9HYPO|nr:3 exoribonuclease family protein [Niveomyces insectorum RCEF 264]
MGAIKGARAGARGPTGAATHKKSRTDNWDSWQDAARNQEADRVRQYASAFQAQTTAARTKAMQNLRRHEESRAKAAAKYLEKVRNACGTAATPAAAVDQPLYTAGREVLDLLQDLLARYEQANDALQALAARSDKVDALREPWEKDRAEARTLLHYGRVYGDSLVHDIIVPPATTAATTATTAVAAGPLSIGSGNQSSHQRALESNLNQTGRSAINLFPRSRATLAQGATWGETARTQMQALTGLMKTLPCGGTDGHSRSVHEETEGSKSVSFAC